MFRRSLASHIAERTRGQKGVLDLGHIVGDLLGECQWTSRYSRKRPRPLSLSHCQ